MQALALNITEGSPVGFEDRAEVLPFVHNLNKSGKSLLTAVDMKTAAQAAGIKLETAMHLGSAFNARQACLAKPSYLVDLVLKNRHGIVSDVVEVNGNSIEVPFNLDYVERYLREAHIVGVRQAVSSATLGRSISAVSFFDLEKVNTEAQIGQERSETLRKLGTLATQMEMQPAPEQNSDMLLRALEDPHVKPERLIEYAKMIDGYTDIFDADAGNWEGFTLGEHTETVLRNFDENFADTLPVEMLAPMRLMLLGHDLGKPKAVTEHSKHKEKEYNLKYAADFFSRLNVPPEIAGLLLSVIGDGAELIYKADIRGQKSAEDNLRSHAARSLQEFNLGRDSATAEQIDGYIELCRVLLTCDGGAYTSMATTRRPGAQGGRYRNAPSFNNSYANPLGLGKRGIKLVSRADERAPVSLTPKYELKQSNIKRSYRGVGRKAPKFTTS